MPMTLPGATESACVGDEFARRHALQRGVDGREQDRRLVAALHARKPRQRRHALRHHAGIRRHAVVGQAIPGREFHHHDIGREERERARQLRHALDRRGRSRRAMIAGASGRAAMARARSASTRPSAPSATCDSVSGRPARSRSAGDFAVVAHDLCPWKARKRLKQRRVDVGRHRFGSVHPGEQSAGRGFRANARVRPVRRRSARPDARRQNGRAQIHLTDAAMPAAEQQPPAPFVQAVDSKFRSTAAPKRQKPGRGRVRVI